MLTRQANWLFAALALLVGLSACAIAQDSPPTAAAQPSSTVTRTPLPIPTLPSSTPTPLTCLSNPGQLGTGSVPTSGTPTTFIIYLPPCYEYFTEERYPVLYLLNGQPFENDPEPPGTQWIRIGAPAAADALIHSGEYPPFIIVFPEDRYWNVVQGTYFGQFMIYDIVPYIDNNFRTIPDRAHRAVGGISRGGGWAWQFALQNPDVFGIVGLHSPAIFPDDRVNLEYWLKNRVSSSWPHIYMDTGRDDHELGYNSILEGMLAGYNVPHEWHLNIGDHTLNYWSKHVTNYLTWYADQFAHAGPPLPTLTPTPSPAPTSTPTLTPTITSTALPAYASTATAEAAETTPTESTPTPTPTVTPGP